MPTPEQEQAVIDSIRRYESASFERRGAFYYESPGGDLSWDDLPENDKLTFLDTNVNWEGFTREQEFAVITRAVEGEDQDFWMDDIEAQALNPKIPVTPEMDRVLSEMEEGWPKEEPGASGPQREGPPGRWLDYSLDYLNDGYEERMREVYHPRDEGKGHER